MKKSATVDLQDGPDGQSLTLPAAFKLDGDAVEISRRGGGLLLRPRYLDWARWRRALADLADTLLTLGEEEQKK